MTGCYSLNSFQLLPKCSVRVIALLCDDSVSQKMQSQNPGSGQGFERVWLLTTQCRVRERQGPTDSTGGCIQTFHFHDPQVGITNSYTCIERQRERIHDGLISFSLETHQFKRLLIQTTIILLFFPLNQACVNGMVFIQDGILK